MSSDGIDERCERFADDSLYFENRSYTQLAREPASHQPGQGRIGTDHTGQPDPRIRRVRFTSPGMQAASCGHGLSPADGDEINPGRG